MTLSEYFAVRLTTEIQEQLEELALKAGVTKSALVRNTVKLVLAPREVPSLLEQIIIASKKERSKSLFGRNQKVKGNGNGKPIE